jgi:phosphoenolpyruvate synthase/pyruvate phosphate dikinase
MSFTIPLQDVRAEDRGRVGGKCLALALMSKQGFSIPDALCVTTDAYEEYVTSTGLRERILLELNRKDFKEMRWEEIWDASLRIRNLFAKRPIPPGLGAALMDSFGSRFREKVVVVRSSAPEEDASRSSFAGLHESFVNIRGEDSILEHIKLVWASLWSDAAILYRREIGLDIETSSMAVLVQEIVIGERSGVTFTKSPNNEAYGVIESVYGLNQGLVDGTVEPDRWTMHRVTGKVISHTSAHRDNYVIPAQGGVQVVPLPDEMAKKPPLSYREAAGLFRIALKAEELFGGAQDVEWTFRDKAFHLLQARPITTISGEKGDDRKWYMSLRRSFENLKVLRKKIEGELIPGMIEEAENLAQQGFMDLSDQQLAAEIGHRSDTYHKWVDVYWTEFIPYAHGARLFGQVYNDAIHPEDPYEFLDLLRTREMASLERNGMLEDMASVIREDPMLLKNLRSRAYSRMDTGFQDKIDEFTRKFGDLSCKAVGGAQCEGVPEGLVTLLLELATHPGAKRMTGSVDLEAMERRFLERFEGEGRVRARELLDLGRSSYRLRDDDNIHLGRIEAQMLAAINEGRRRLEERGMKGANSLEADELIKALEDPEYSPKITPLGEKQPAGRVTVKARQLVGQPAGPGVSKGTAHVVAGTSDLSDFKYGRILVCDAVDPTMTFVVPLASAVVERRGGMLIHGAIIAREYGLPCVTGVPKATTLIRTGDALTVDGYLGIVTIG